MTFCKQLTFNIHVNVAAFTPYTHIHLLSKHNTKKGHIYAYCTYNRTLGVTLMSDINNTNTMTASLLTIVNAD